MNDMDGSGKSFFKKTVGIVTYSILLFAAVLNIGAVFQAVIFMLALLSPLFTGLVIAFILNILLRVLENKLFAPLNRYAVWRKIGRAVCVVLCYVLVILLIVLLVQFVVPEFVQNLTALGEALPDYLDTAEGWITEMSDRFNLNLSGTFLEDLELDWDSFTSKLGNWLSTLFPQVLELTKSITNGVISFVVALVLSVYMLLNKEKLIRQIRKFCYAYFKKPRADRMCEVGSTANHIFHGFVAGQLTEALIFGSLCFAGMMIFGFSYPLLISVVMGVMALIPIVGAFAGAIFAAFIILMQQGLGRALWFIIFITALQQVEGNLIYPRVVGKSVGLPGMWVLLVITVGGSIAGLPGMALGVPVASLLYALCSKDVNARLRKKGIVIKTPDWETGPVQTPPDTPSGGDQTAQ